MNNLLESIVNNFINGNKEDCKELIREYAEFANDVYDLLSYYKLVTGSNDQDHDSFVNTIYLALLNH